MSTNAQTSGQRSHPTSIGPLSQLNVLAAIALVMAIVIAPVGVVLGHMALVQIKRNGGGGRAFALASLAVGYPLTLVMALVFIPMIF